MASSYMPILYPPLALPLTRMALRAQPHGYVVIFPKFRALRMGFVRANDIVGARERANVAQWRALTFAHACALCIREWRCVR